MQSQPLVQNHSIGWHRLSSARVTRQERDVIHLGARPLHRLSSDCKAVESKVASTVEPAHEPVNIPDGSAAPSSNTTVTQDPSVKSRLWKAAIKLPMYSVGYMPVLVGGASVFYLHDVLPWTQVGGYALSAILIIAWLNLSNDAFDAETGVDDSKPESLVNLTGNRPLIGALAALFFVLGVSGLGSLLSSADDWRPVAMLAFSIACGYVYQGPPFRFSYKGLGEPLCFMAFGPSATTAFYLAMTESSNNAATAGDNLQQAVASATASASAAVATSEGLLSLAPPSVWWCSVLVGITTTVILFTSHFHQIEGDRKAGKMSPLVRLGIDNGLMVLKSSVLSTYLLATAGVVGGALPSAVLPSILASLPAAGELIKFADDNHQVPAKIAPLKKYTCFWHITFQSALAAGLVIARVAADAGLPNITL